MAVGGYKMKKFGKVLLATTALTAGLLTVNSCSKKKVVEGNIIYSAPNASVDGKGTESSPLEIRTAMLKLKPGETLVLKEGNYKLEKNIYIPDTQDGTAKQNITVKAEEGKKVTIDFSLTEIADSNRGIQLNADYWYFYGLDVMGAGDNGMYIGGSYNVIENCSFHENQDTGLQLGRSSGMLSNAKDWPHNNLIKNCTSYNNYDYKSNGENADGFAAKLTVGEGNVFDGCIAYRNADDGWDLYAKSDTGNIGTVIIKNSVAFENGWLLEKAAAPDDSDLDSNGQSKIKTTADMLAKTSNCSYTTRDGDGIGFKLGGSIMEGNVIMENCAAFNNRLHGISDNSNPGVLSLRNCTAYNNSVTPNKDTGEVGPSNADNKSNNFDTARTAQSYNNYYGLLSYTTNQTEAGVSYTNSDAFIGSTAYSIFCLGKNKYTAFTNYQDASSYDLSKQGSSYNKMNDSVFESLTLPFAVNGNREVHTALRNADGSINLGSLLNVQASELLTFCEGKQIGAKLNLTSWDQYDHYQGTDFTNTDLTENQIHLQEALDALTIMCNSKAVYQDLKLLTYINGYKVSWSSSNEVLLEIGTKEYQSSSNVSYVYGMLTRDRKEDKSVVLTATIENEGDKISKNFEFIIKKDTPTIGSVVGFEERYILTQFEDYELPQVGVLNAAYISQKYLVKDVDYKVWINILYAKSSSDFLDNNYTEVSKVYTSLPGVYKVIYTIESLIPGDEQRFETSFFAYVVSEGADIDIKTDAEGNPSYEVNVSRDGVKVEADFTNILGYMYIYATKDVILENEAQKVIEKGEQFAITDESLTATYKMPNNEGYNVYVVVTNKRGGSVSKVYSSTISIENISSEQDFYNLATGSTSMTTIYLLTKDLDFTNFTWKCSTESFGGLFNGNGYTIKNLTVKGIGKKDAAVFYRVKNGTIMNVNFKNIDIIGAKDISSFAAIVGQMSGGYLYNIGITDINVSSYAGAAGLVGQVAGGVNDISRISVVINEGNEIKATSKYIGGIVANVQKDTSEDKIELTMSNCYVKGTVGDGKDTGGYVGGIVGRAKNDFATCSLKIEQCYYEGMVMTNKNYAAGILGGNDNGAGNISINKCAVNCTIYFAGTILDGLTDATMAEKNCSPIYGRYTKGSGKIYVGFNYANFADSQVSTDYENFYENIKMESFWAVTLGLDLENTWVFDQANYTVYLKTPTPNTK